VSLWLFNEQLIITHTHTLSLSLSLSREKLKQRERQRERERERERERGHCSINYLSSFRQFFYKTSKKITIVKKLKKTCKIKALPSKNEEHNGVKSF
jgi:hypothetical protein